MALKPYSEFRFQQQVQEAMKAVRKILHATREPRLANKVHHQYVDKYLLVENLINTAIASQLNGLARLGLSRALVEQIRDWARDKSVSLQIRSSERCVFLRKEEREVEGNTKYVKTEEKVTTSGASESTRVEHKVVTNVTEYFWNFEVEYTMSVFPGVSVEEAPQICSGSASHVIKTTTDKCPRSGLNDVGVPKLAVSVDISWLASAIDPQPPNAPCFSVNREAKSCATPRRNAEVQAAIAHFEKFHRFGDSVFRYFNGLHNLFSSSRKEISPSFVPVLPLLEQVQSPGQDSLDGGSPALLVAMPTRPSDPHRLVLSATDANNFLGEESRSIDETCSELATRRGADFFSMAETSIVVVMQHIVHVAQHLSDALEFVEGMLREQLLAAIGRELTPGDFAAYMRFHNRKIFNAQFEPQPFCYPIRRSVNHAPEGILSIEESSTEEDAIGQPIAALVNSDASSHAMQFPIGAGTRLTFGGSRYIHAICLPQFSSESGVKFSLEARAHQFSCFIILIGRIASATMFEPKYAAIVQNKDEFSIPLEMSTIPAPKDFRDAIESLSPEQQAFAKAFRAMQLESTLFGVLTIQIKPQMETLLGLPEDALTKEISLTQDLLELFTEYNLSGDLVSFTGDVDASPSAKLEAVKGHVKRMQDVLKQGMQAEIEAAKAKAEQELLEEKKRLEEESRSVYEVSRSVRSVHKKVRSASPSHMSLERQGSCDQGAAVRTSDYANSTENANASQNPQQSAADQARGDGGGSAGDQIIDYTLLPQQMDQRFEDMDEERSLRPTIISASDVWKKVEKKSLLVGPETSTLRAAEQKCEREKAYDLLDSLTNSGALPINCSSLHVVLAATHHFEKDIIETVIQDNKNPIEKVERSSLLMATTIHRQPAAALVKTSEVPRLRGITPALFDNV